MGRYLLGLLAVGLLASLVLADEKTPPKDTTVLPTDVKLFRLVVNKFWETNCYILAGKTGEAIVIDPGDELTWLTDAVLVDRETGKSTPTTAEEVAKSTDGGDSVVDPVTGKKRLIYRMYKATGEDAKRIYDTLVKNNLKLKYIVISHGHIDHIGAAGYLKERFPDVKIVMNREDTRAKDGSKLPPEVKNEKVDAYPKDAYTLVGGLPKVDQFVKDGDLLSLDGMVLEVLLIPGHSYGSIALRTRYEGRQVIFDGDTLLYHTIGRSNFRDGTGDGDLLLRSIREKLFCYPDDTVIYTGHYNPTTVGEEKANNYFLRDQNKVPGINDPAEPAPARP